MIFKHIKQMMEKGVSQAQITISPASGGQLQVAAVFRYSGLQPVVVTALPEELDLALATGQLDAPLESRCSLLDQLNADRATGAATAAVSGASVDSDLDEPTEVGAPSLGQPVMVARQIEPSQETEMAPTLDLFGYRGQPTQL